MRRPPRIAVLIALLAGAAAWVAIDLRGPAAPPSAKAPASGASQDPERAAAPGSEAKQPGIPARSALGRIAADPFSAQSWLPRRKPAVVSAPPDPVTPPLPYRFAGQFHRESGIEVYVARGEEVFPVKEGDTLDGQYKIDSVSATEVSFIFLPSGARQTLQFSPLKEQELAAQGGPPRTRTPASAAFSADVAGGEIGPRTCPRGLPVRQLDPGQDWACATQVGGTGEREGGRELQRVFARNLGRADPRGADATAVRPGCARIRVGSARSLFQRRKDGKFRLPRQFRRLDFRRRLESDFRVRFRRRNARAHFQTHQGSRRRGDQRGLAQPSRSGGSHDRVRQPHSFQDDDHSLARVSPYFNRSCCDARSVPRACSVQIGFRVFLCYCRDPKKNNLKRRALHR